MLILGFLLNGLGVVLDLVLQFVLWVVIIRALISWVNPDPFNSIVRFLTSVSDPLLKPIRRYMPQIGGGIDLSPLILIIFIYFLKASLVGLLYSYAAQLGAR